MFDVAQRIMTAGFIALQAAEVREKLGTLPNHLIFARRPSCVLSNQRKAVCADISIDTVTTLEKKLPGYETLQFN
eukprot:SAG31_NODE_3086_length_4691_cov_36.726916_2_plen_75_part_00